MTVIWKCKPNKPSPSQDAFVRVFCHSNGKEIRATGVNRDLTGTQQLTPDKIAEKMSESTSATHVVPPMFFSPALPSPLSLVIKHPLSNNLCMGQLGE